MSEGAHADRARGARGAGGDNFETTGRLFFSARSKHRAPAQPAAPSLATPVRMPATTADRAAAALRAAVRRRKLRRLLATYARIEALTGSELEALERRTALPLRPMRARALLRTLPNDLRDDIVTRCERRARAHETGALLHQYFRALEAELGAAGNRVYLDELEDRAYTTMHRTLLGDVVFRAKLRRTAPTAQFARDLQHGHRAFQDPSRCWLCESEVAMCREARGDLPVCAYCDERVTARRAATCRCAYCDERATATQARGDCRSAHCDERGDLSARRPAGCAHCDESDRDRDRDAMQSAYLFFEAAAERGERSHAGIACAHTHTSKSRHAILAPVRGPGRRQAPLSAPLLAPAAAGRGAGGHPGAARHRGPRPVARHGLEAAGQRRPADAAGHRGYAAAAAGAGASVAPRARAGDGVRRRSPRLRRCARSTPAK